MEFLDVLTNFLDAVALGVDGDEEGDGLGHVGGTLLIRRLGQFVVNLKLKKKDSFLFFRKLSI